MDAKLMKRFYHIVETLKIHGEIAYGTSDINVEALANFLASPSFAIQCWGAENEDEVEQYVINDILNGMPVWRFFNLSPWAQEMQEREWQETLREEQARAEKEAEDNKKKYKCLQGCVHYDYHQGNLGTFVRCRAKNIGGDAFKLCQRCKHFSTEESRSIGRRMRPRWNTRN